MCNLTRRRNPAKLSVEQISEQYGFHKNTIYHWFARGEVPFHRKGRGRKIWVLRADLLDFLARTYDLEEVEK